MAAGYGRACRLQGRPPRPIVSVPDERPSRGTLPETARKEVNMLLHLPIALLATFSGLSPSLTRCQSSTSRESVGLRVGRPPTSPVALAMKLLHFGGSKRRGRNTPARIPRKCLRYLTCKIPIGLVRFASFEVAKALADDRHVRLGRCGMRRNPSLPRRQLGACRC